MDHLSSCYFCGTAVDGRLQQYRVVPAELRDSDDVATTTLCSSCHAKLERLLGPVADAAGADGATLDARDADRQQTDAGDDATGGDGPQETTSSEESDADDDGGDGLVDVEPTLVDVDDPLGGGEESPDDEETVRVTHTETAGDGADDTGPASGADDTERSGPEGTAQNDRGGTKSGEESGEEIGEGKGDESGEGQGAESPGSDGDESGEGGSGDTAQTTVSALEYNKVMRLLQNREFPVDRAEIQTVAANAYGLAEHECASVIDLAIDRGLIGEQDGKLVRAE